MHILSWIIFIGLSIDAGGFISNTLYALLVNASIVSHFWGYLDLSAIYQYDHGHFYAITIFMSIVALAKAIMFYLIVKILHNKKLNLIQPFNKELGNFIFNLSYLALLIGLFSNWGENYFQWIVSKGVKTLDMHSLKIGGGDIWLFMSVTLFIIAQIFKKGIEIQSENDLTV